MFNREVIIEIISLTAIERITKLKTTFSVSKSDDSSMNKATVSIVNINRKKILNINKDDTITIKAGYKDEGGAKPIFIGTITKVDSDNTAPETMIVIEAHTGEDKLKRVSIKKEYPKNSSVRSILKDLMVTSGYKVGINIDTIKFKDATLAGGFYFSGTLEEAFDKVTDMVNLNWTIEDDEIKVFDRYTPEVQIQEIINQSSGLIGSPKRTKIKHKHLNKNVDGWMITTLLKNTLKLHGKITLQSKEILNPSPFTVVTIEHEGNSWDDILFSKIGVIDGA